MNKLSTISIKKMIFRIIKKYLPLNLVSDFAITNQPVKELTYN